MVCTLLVSAILIRYYKARKEEEEEREKLSLSLAKYKVF
jgi:hypothetical protein